MKFNKNQTLNFTSKLSNFEIVNREFIRCKCYMLATGDNVSGSDITLKAVQKAISRGEFYNKPIVAHLYQDPEDNNKWRVGGHDSKWIITDTSFEIINECIPFGTIPESSDLQLEEVLEADGETVNTYLACQIILWTGRFNIMDAAYSDDIYFNQSCELSVNEYHWKENNILAIDDFTFSALCLLNKSDDKSKNVRPCFPSCRIEKIKTFSINTDKFRQNFEIMLKKLKQYETDNNSVQNKNKKLDKEEKNFMNLEKLNDFLSAFTFKDKHNNDVLRYALLGNITENSFTVIDREDNFKVYTVEFALDDEQNIAADWDAKTEKKFVLTDTNNESAVDLNTVIDEYAQSKADVIVEDLTISFNNKIDEMAQEYDTLAKELAASNKKLADFEAAKAEADKAAHKMEIDAVIEKFAKKMGRSPKFLVYKAKVNPDEVTVEQVTQDLTLMAGQEMIGDKSVSFSYQPQEVKIVKSTGDEITARYGHLLDKYRK